MLRNMKDLDGCSIRATDGVVGHVDDFYFDDERWVIRYLVVDTGTWLSRKVLISPMSIGHPDWAEKTLPVLITAEQVKSSPDIDTDKPVSRQHEILHLGYYGYPYYWGGAGLWGRAMYPNLMMTGETGFASTRQELPSEVHKAYVKAERAAHRYDDQHLRSCNAVMSYHIHATDGDIGHVKGLLVDDESWAIRYLIVDTSNWWLGHQMLIAPEWIEDVSWPDSSISVNLTRRAVQDAPPYDPSVTMKRGQEVDIYNHYLRPGYWEDGQFQATLSATDETP
jgi:hypothetical protein